MGKGKRNKQLRVEDVAGAPQKRQNKSKKQFVMPKWAKIAICAVLLAAIIGGIVAASIINSGVIYRNRVIIESESGKFDLNQQMAAFILWQTAYQQAYYEYLYTSYGIYQDVNKILVDYLSPNDYAVITATSVTNSKLKAGITEIEDYLSKMVASADAALEAGLKLEAHDKEEAKAYVEQLQMYYAEFRNQYASKYDQAEDTVIWNLRANLALSNFQEFLELSVGDTFKASDIEDAAKLMIMYSKYTDYMSLQLEDDATNDMLQDFILRHPAGHFETKYFSFTGAEVAMIRNFFSDKFMEERYKSTVAKYVASLDLNKNMTAEEKTAQLKALGMDTFTTYTKTVDADGNASYSNDLNEKIGEVVFNTGIKKDQISVIADGEKVYLVYFNADSTATTATLSYKEYTYEACKDKLPEIENIENVIAECIKTGENTTEFKTDNDKAAELLGQLNDNKDMAMPEGATVANTTSASKEDSANTVPTSILDVLYGKNASVKENWNFTVNDPTVSYVVKVTAIEKDADGKNTTNYTISYVEFKDDAFAALLSTFEEEFTLYLLDTKTNAPTYSMEFDTFEEKVVDWLLDENFVELVLGKYANKDLDDLLAAKKETDKTNFNEMVENLGGLKDFTKSYATEKEFETKYDSKVYDYIFNSKNKDTATVIVGNDDRVFLVYVAPKAEGDDANTVHAAIKEYKIEDYEGDLKVGTGEDAKTFREQIKADLLADDRKNTTGFKASEDLAKAELDALNKTESPKTWPEGLSNVKTYKPAKTSETTGLKLNTAPQAIIDKIYPSGTSATSVSIKTGSYYQADDGKGTSYVFKVISTPAKDDTNLTCEIQYQTFEDENAYCGYFRTIKNKLDASLKATATDLKYPDSITDGSYQDWLFEGEYVEAKDGKEADHVFERTENDLTFIAATDSKNNVTTLTIYLVKEVAKQVTDETEAVYGGYLSFATKKDAEKAYKQLQKCKTDFAVLDKFISLESTSKDANGEEVVNRATLDFALKKDSSSIEANVKNWLFGERDSFDFEVVESADGKSYYLVVFVSKEGTSLRTARTDWIDEKLLTHLDNLVKDGGYTFNEEALNKIEDVTTTTTTK